MSKKRVLIVTQEMKPYTALSEISEIANKLPQHIQKNGMEIRVLMPRYGVINERRHRLHEVVRLSGMNIIVNDDDYPLIIKVASLPQARMQVYFLDNEDFFKRKSVFEDSEGKAFEDNEDRMIFFCKGVLETVKKFGWPPDIIHCHGWMTSLVPAYLKTAYQHEPLFQDSKIVYSAYDYSLGNTFSEEFVSKASINDMSSEKLSVYSDDNGIALHKGAISFSDAVIQGSESIDEDLAEFIEKSETPFLNFSGEENLLEGYMEFYNSLLEEKVEE
ncbi:MAG: starch synthase [Maribacter sp.]|jgi:starch synthase